MMRLVLSLMRLRSRAALLKLRFDLWRVRRQLKTMRGAR